MTQSDYTHINVLLDRSGSMGGIRQPTIQGFNTFLDQQKLLPGRATISLVQFDDRYEPNYDFRPLPETTHLSSETYAPRGETALYDSLVRSIRETGDRLAAMPEAIRPGKVLFVVITDGGENASIEHSVYSGGRDRMRRLVELQRGTYSWNFIYLGANQDAILSAREMGIPLGYAMNFQPTSYGVQSAFMAASSASACLRSANFKGDNFFGSMVNAEDMPGSSVGIVSTSVPTGAANP